MASFGKTRLARPLMNGARFVLAHALGSVILVGVAFLFTLAGAYYGGIEWGKIGFLAGAAVGGWFGYRIAEGISPGCFAGESKVPRNEFGEVPEIAVVYVLVCIAGGGLAVGWVLWNARIGMILGSLPAFCASALFLWQAISQLPAGDAKRRLEPYRDDEGNIADQKGYDRECRRMDYERRLGWIEAFFLLTSLFVFLAAVFGGTLVYWAIGVPIFLLLQGFGLLKWL